MQKLSLEKFQDAKLDKRQLSYVHGGHTCTGGGGTLLYSHHTHNYENNTITITNQYKNYTSDEIDHNGITGYLGVSYSSSSYTISNDHQQ